MAQNEYPGIGRIAYLLMSFGIWVLAFLVLVLGYSAMPESMAFVDSERDFKLWMVAAMLIPTLLLCLAFILPTILRLRNLGMSGWWLLAYLIPILDLWLLWRILVCPAGYADHKQLDLPGKILTGILLILIGLPLLLSIVEVFTSS